MILRVSGLPLWSKVVQRRPHMTGSPTTCRLAGGISPGRAVPKGAPGASSAQQPQRQPVTGCHRHYGALRIPIALVVIAHCCFACQAPSHLSCMSAAICASAGLKYRPAQTGNSALRHVATFSPLGFMTLFCHSCGRGRQGGEHSCEAVQLPD